MITVNSGAEQSKQFGALTHIGQDETVAGKAVGDELNQRGRKHALCVLHEQGNVGLEQRCAGAKATFHGTMDKLYVDGTNMPDVQSAIEAKLQADKSIDSVVTLGAPFAATAAKAEAGGGLQARRSTPSTSTPRSPPRSRPAPSASPSTSSPTSRATRRSTCCGCTATTRTPSAAASRS